MQSKMIFRVRHAVLASAVMGALCLVGLTSSNAAQAADNVAAQAHKEALNNWHESIKHLPPPTEGCFHASFPSTVWSRVACGSAPRYRSRIHWKTVRTANGTLLRPETAGNGTDYVAQAPSTTVSAVGSFPSVSGLTSEQGVNVPFGGGESDGITGNNEYTLQLNTDINSSSTACSNFGYSSCQVWEQFVYSTNNNGTPAEPQVFIQNWVFPSQSDYQNVGCPNGWNDASGNGQYACFTNSDATNVPAVSATDLGNLTLTGAVTSDGNDTVTFTDGSEAYSASEPDSTNSLGSWWTQSEFNVVGNAGGSEAQFNSGTSLTVNLAVNDGNGDTPSCVGPNSSGTTGETNNLNLGSCNAVSGSAPAIQFTESN
ncbi:hypothetical protein [Dyella sp. 2HG41-7]|uniref:hypothetical protein n=1 Tax=Dyella sp. 2HG41-7 TaxID=2883239 RepID=UPI001F1D2A42|nr:hypothetical protein [Dyella sp. 2HG41-7]